ncbi:MAG: hypothetical protein AAGI72_15450 [Pseudomonadota bacterium]
MPMAPPTPPESDPEPDSDADPAPDGAEPDPDPVDGPMPAERPDLGKRGEATNSAYVGPYVPAESRMPTLTYKGGFQIDRGTFGVSSIASHKGAFSVSGDRLLIAGNRSTGRDVGVFEIPTLADNPENAIARNVVPFFRLAGVSGNHLTDVYLWGDWILAMNTTFYDGSDTNTCYVLMVRADRSEQARCHDLWAPKAAAPEWRPQMSGGSFFKPPAEMVDALGGSLCMHGEHWINIIRRYSAGPSLSCFYPDLPAADRVVRLTAHMYYPYNHTVGQHGSSRPIWVPEEPGSASGEWLVRQRKSNPVFNRLSRYEGCFIWMPTDSYVCVGLNAGQRYGDWYGPDKDGNAKDGRKTHVQKGTHTGHPDEMPKGVINPNCRPGAWSEADRSEWCRPETPGKLRSLRDQTNYVWIWDMPEILAADKPWSPEPAEWQPLNPLLPEDARPGWIVGAFFDTDTNYLYVINGRGIVRVYQVS